jgi:hypothetical protein
VHELLKNNIDETEKKIHEKNDVKKISKKNSKKNSNNDNNEDIIKKRISSDVAVNDEVKEGNIIEKGMVNKSEITVESTPIKNNLNLENDCCNKVKEVNIGSYNCGEENDGNNDVNAELVKSKNEIEIDNIIDNIDKNNNDDTNFSENEGVHVIVDDDGYESSWNCMYLSKKNKENKRISCVIS